MDDKSKPTFITPTKTQNDEVAYLLSTSKSWIVMGLSTMTVIFCPRHAQQRQKDLLN